MHTHVHFENSVLFPAAVEMAGANEPLKVSECGGNPDMVGGDAALVEETPPPKAPSMPAHSTPTHRLFNRETTRTNQSIMACKHSNQALRAAAPDYWALVDAGEPFRILFPLGALTGIIGVALWPLYVWKILPTYPGLMHSRIMIMGFLTSFVVGFLGTAFPRLLDVPRLRSPLAIAFAFAIFLGVAAHFTGATLGGDILFTGTLLSLVATLAGRFPQRKDVPPPAFVLVAGGLLCGIIGGAIQVIAGLRPDVLPDLAYPLGRLLLHQGYLLLPIMGIGAFLLPRFFGLPNRQNFPESLSLPPGWIPRALFAATCGLVVVAGFVLEAKGMVRAGMAARALGLLVYFLREVPIHQAKFSGGSLALGLRLAMLSLPMGYALMAVWPEHGFSFIHVVMISGFSLLTFIVASRVVYGHSGQAGKFQTRLKPVLTLIVFVMLAMLTRVSADWMPAIRLSHYGYAGLSWIAGVIVWIWSVLPGVTRADGE